MNTVHSFLTPVLPPRVLQDLVIEYIGLDGFTESAQHELGTLDKVIKHKAVSQCKHVEHQYSLLMDEVLPTNEPENKETENSINNRIKNCGAVLQQIAQVITKPGEFICTRYVLLTLTDYVEYNYAQILALPVFVDNFSNKILLADKVSEAFFAFLMELTEQKLEIEKQKIESAKQKQLALI